MLIIALFVFLAVIFFAMILVFRQIMTKNVVSATEHLDEMNHEYLRKEDELNKQLEESKQKAKDMVSQAQEEAEKLKARIIADTEAEKDKVLKNAHLQSSEIINQAEKSRQMLLSEIDERIKKEALEKASRLLQEVLPEGFRQDAHLHWIEELVKNGFAENERLELPPGEKQVKIISAFPLKEEERKVILKRLKGVLGQDILPQEELDPSLVAGLVIHIGSLVLDGSLKNKIKEKAKNTDE
jgi:F0F1-type ATP synthase delta subunit